MSKSKAAILTIIGGLVGLIVSLIPITVSRLALHKLYYVVLILIPVCICLFIRIFRGNRSISALIYATALSLVGVYLASAVIMAANLIDENSLPAGRLFQLFGILTLNVNTYGGELLTSIFSDVFNVIFILAYLAVGIMFSWEFIFKSAKKPAADNEDEYELVYEDELEPDDEVVEDKKNSIR